jgi:hypothetical protein
VLALAATVAATGDDWREIVAERARALLALRAANRRARVFRDALAKKTELQPSLPCDRVSGIFASPPLTDAAQAFLEAAREFGAVSATEISNASK